MAANQVAYKPMSEKPDYEVIKSANTSELYMIVKAFCGKDIATVISDNALSGEEFVSYGWSDVAAMLSEQSFKMQRRVFKLTLKANDDFSEPSPSGGACGGEPCIDVTPKSTFSGSRPKSSSAKKRSLDGYVGHPSARLLEYDSSSSSDVRSGKSKVRTSCLNFTMYRSRGLTNSIESGYLSDTDRKECIQVTIENMRSTLSDGGYEREPNNDELNEVALQLCKEYAALCEGDDKRRRHDGVFNSLKRRIANTKYRKGKKQKIVDKRISEGKSPYEKKPPRRSLSVGEAKAAGKKPDDESEEDNSADADLLMSAKPKKITPAPSEIDSASEDETSPEQKEVATALELKKHFDQLEVEMGKERKNWKLIHNLMDLEFPGKCVYVSKIKYTSWVPRIEAILEVYPALKNPNALMFEIKRWSNGERYFVRDTAKAIADLMKTVVNYGTNIGKIKLENQKDETIATTFLTSLPKIFPNKNRKPKDDLLVITTAGQIQKYVNTSEQPKILFFDDRIQFTAGAQSFGDCEKPSDLEGWAKVLMVIMGIFYAFRFGFPHAYEVGLMIVQKCGIKDDPDDAEIARSDFKKQLKKFEEFVSK